MSGSGFRGRGYGPRGARSNGPSNGFSSGPRFPHPNFNHSRPLHRLQGPDKWIDGPNFPPWQQNKGYGHRLQYRGNLQYRPNGRGRSANGRGGVRFSGPGRPPAPQFSLGFIRNQGPRALLPQEDQLIEEDKCILTPQIPLLGSEEERQQKITETADKLKQKLSSITEEDLTNFWEDDFSILPNIVCEDESIRSKGIPELRHEPPELDLTFTDFRDIGRVDCNNSRFDDIDDSTNNDCVSIPFANEVTDRLLSTNDEITVVNESAEDCLIILDSVQDDVLDQPDVLLESDACQQEAFHELLDPECNLESLHLQCDIVPDSGISLNPDDADGNLAVLNVNEDITDSTYIQPIDDVVNENPPLDLIDIEAAPLSLPALNDQDVSDVDFTENPNLLQVAIQDIEGDTIQDINLDVHQDDEVETDLHHTDNLPANVFQEEACPISANASDAPESNMVISPPLNEDNQSNTIGDTVSPTCSSYNEVHNLNNDTKLNNPPHFQPRGFNVPPRFGPRIPGPRCPGPRWGFQQNGNNGFFRGPQRLPFHGNRMPPPRHIVPFQPNNLVPVPFDPRAPPPFTHNVPAPSHDSQHHALVPFSSNDLPPSFDPTEPPPNIRPVSGTEPSNRQDIAQTMPPLDTRNQATNVPPNNMEIMQPPPTFDPREPPPRISNVMVNASENLPEFNPQQPPPKIHKRDETLQPPPIFDPRLSSQERSKLLAPINTSAAHMIPGFNLTPVAPNFAQPPPMNMPSHQAFMPSLPVNFQPVLPQANAGQVIVQEFALPPPPMTITNVPPPLPQEISLEKDSNHSQGVNMDDDGLEDMQEAMEFAKQIMNMTEDLKNNQSASSELTEAPITPLEIPVPVEDIPCSSSVEDVSGNTAKKQKKKENKIKKIKQTLVCSAVLEKQEEVEVVDAEQSVEIRDRTSEDVLLAGDQIRPKVVFNLNSKTKVIPKPDEWHRPPARVLETKETQQVTPQNSHKEKTHTKKHSSESRRNNVNPNKKPQREHHPKTSLTRSAEVPRPFMLEKSSDTSHHQEHTRDVAKLHSHSSAVHKSQKSRKEAKKVAAPTSESSWKNRVISRFLKMSKNDICNMVNNSSLRKFDIAMKHLVKERRSSLSLEMRNTEDEKMKEYDREEFMNQLNAMLDPGAVVGITDLPTEFIHHLSEVLQLDPMPFEPELTERESAEINEVKNVDQTDMPKTYTSEYLQEEIKEAPPFPEYSECENIYIEQIEEQPVHNKEESLPFPINPELNLNISRENTTSSRKSLMNKSNPEAECMYKKQQPLFNEADLDDILLQVTERTKVPAVRILPRKKTIEIHKDSSVTQPVTEAFKCNAFPQIPTKTAADLDDIFSAGIARAKSLNKSADSDHSRARKSSSEDRNTFRSERYERWNRKEQEDPDSFRNLTKEEWEAKYGSNTGTQASIRKTSSNSAENLSRDSRNYHSQRYCSSDSPMRHLSMSPLLREPPAHNPERSMDHYNELEESRRAERSGSSTDTTTTSDSDSDEETVAPNVTKLLKVIKEKEKIAKKKSLNETIRDEVAAEIEKKWKEKSKHKERKSRKRERRKRDKREKRKKEKKKRRRRNSHSDVSKSSEQSEEYRMLTEDEIKKEVVVKQEPLSTFEDSVPFQSGASNTYVPPTSSGKGTEPTPQVESQSPLLGRQPIPVDTSDKIPPQPRNKPTIISMTIQPKTKAQLKQMPESSNLAQKQMTEKLSEADNNGAGSSTNTDGRVTKEHAEKTKGSQAEEGDNESTVIALFMNNALPQANVSTINSSPQTNMSTNNPLPQANVSTNESLPQVSVSPSNSFPQTSPSVSNSSLQAAVSVNNSLPQINLSANTSSPQINVPANTSLPQINLSSNITESPHTDVSNDNITANATSLTSTPTNPDTEVNNGNQSTIQKVPTAGTSSTETKSSYKKIDIKAYKERALQRRLREEAKLKEISGSSVSLPQESQPALPVHKTDNETGGNEAKVTEIDLITGQIKDPRLAKIKSGKISACEDSNKEVKEAASLEKEHKCTDLVQSNKEHPAFVQSKTAGESSGCKVKEKSTTRAIDSDSSSPKDPVKSKEHKNEAKAFSPDKVVKRDEVGEKAETEEKKSKKLPGAVESNKFKNIRSEGSKELKLKKEKIAKSAEKKRKLKSKSMGTEKPSKHSHERIAEEAQKPLTASIDSAISTDVEKASSSNVPELQLSERTEESCLELATCPENVAAEDSIGNEVNKEQVDTYLAVEENNEKIVDDNEEAKILETPQTTDEGIKEIVGDQLVVEQERIEAEGDQTLFNCITEESSAKEIEENVSNSPEESTARAESVSTEKLDKEEDMERDMALFNQTSPVPIEESVVEDKFVEDKFLEDKPAEDKPVEDKPVEDTPVEDKLVEDRPAEDKFDEDKSVEDAFAEETPVEDTPLSTVDLPQVNQEPYSVEEDIHLDDKENLEDTVADSTPTPHAEMDTEVVDKDSTNAETKVNEKEESELRSPDSVGSPFIGFVAESIGDEANQVPKLADLDTSNVDTEEGVTENCKQQLETCSNDESCIKAVESDKDDMNFSMEMKETDEAVPDCKLTEEEGSSTENDVDKMIPDSFDPLCNVEADAEPMETENTDTAKESQVYNNDMEQNVSPVINLDSQDTFGEDGEPFIVLDEYIDDADGKSLEKLSAFGLDLEDCIARDADIFSSKHIQEEEGLVDNIQSSNFNAIDFKELSEVFDKDNITPAKEEETNYDAASIMVSTELFTHTDKEETNMISPEPNIEPSTESSQNSKSTDTTPKDTAPEVSTESSPTDVPFVKDVPQEPVPQALSIDIVETEQEQGSLPLLHSPETPETMHPEASETVRPVASETVRPDAPETVRPEAPETVRPEAPETPRPEAPETVHLEAPKTVRPEAPKTVRPEAPEPVHLEAPETVRPEAPETVRPEAPETVPPEAPETVRSEAPETVHPEAPKIVRPEAPKTVHHEAPKTVHHEAPETVRPEAPETVRPEAPMTVRPEAPKTVRPEAPKTVHHEAPETVRPEAPKIVRPEAPKTVRHEAPETVRPQAPETVRPEAPETVRPEAPETVRPEAPKTVRPEAPKTVRPEASATVRPEAPKTVRPEAPKSVRPEASATVRPEAPKTVRPEAPKSVRPEASATVRPEAPMTVRPEAPKTVRPEAPKTVRPEASATMRPETPTKPTVPIETALGKSSDSLSPDAAPQPETKAELVKPNKEADNCEKGSEKNVDDSVGSKVILTPEASTSFDKHAPSSSTEEKKRPHHHHADKRHRSASKSHQKREDEALHKIKSKSRMKHKEHKKHSVPKNLVEEAVQSDTVKVKYPSTKEAIIARMIEIDVEIHKLMTEKMTLYDMLTNNALPTDNDLPQNNTVHESKEADTVVVRPRTPSALMSQLIQNIEASPVTNQCAKTTAESSSSKDSAANSAQSSKSKASKHEHHSEKKANSTLTRNSDNEEAASHSGDAKSSSSRKKKRPKWAIKWKEPHDSIDTSSEAVTEEKQTSDAVKSILKKASTKQKATEPASTSFAKASTSEVKLPERSTETPPQIDKEDSTSTDKTESPSSEVNEKAIKPPEPQAPSDAPVKLKTPENSDENVSPKENESTIEALNDTDTASSVIKAPENRTPERSSIYSDDSTWDSLLQNSSIDDQKKPTTGLALLEETYRKELAKSRRVRTESRRRRRKKMLNPSQPVKTLTPEEEELPLSALYSKKVHAKKKSQSPGDQQAEKSKDEQQLWKNVDEVINAVAENRTADLYAKRSERQSPSEDSQSNVPRVDQITSANPEKVNDPESNSEQKPTEEEERTAVPSVPQSIEEVCNEPAIDSKGTTSSDGKDDVSNDSQLTTPCPNTSQDLSGNEEQVPKDAVTVEPQSIEDLLGTTVNIDESALEPFAQEVAESNNAETSRAVTPVESSERCIMESSICSVYNDENLLDIPEINVDSVKIEEEEVADEKNKEPDQQEEAVNVEKIVSPDAVVSENFEKDQDNSNEPHSSKSVGTASEITLCNSNENSNIETGDVNEESSKDTLPKQQAQCEKDNADDNSEKFYDVLKEECLLRAKEHRGSQRRRESERSNKSSSEESSRIRTSTSSLSENTSSLKSEDAGVKRTAKRKRGSSRTPLRRSSRYTEEITKRIKVEVDASVPSTEQESQEKNPQVQLPNVSPTLPSSGNEEAESATNSKKNRSVQKTISRKRCLPPELDILPSQSLGGDELSRDAKRCKQQTVPTIMNCQVRLVDSKHTILKPNVNPNELKKYGISTINPYVYPNSGQLDHLSFTSPVQSTPAKDLSSASTKRATPTTETSQSQTSKVVIKKAEDAAQSISDEASSAKIKGGPKSAQINVPAGDGERCTDPDREVMPVLTKEQVLVDISQECEKPDVEIVEEKTIVTKSQHHNDSGSTLTVIETKDDKEQPRTQYTVHKGPILDIKVFENSFLAASEDGRIYRYSQASNGILNIYKGHKAAVTCLYVFNTSGTDINKEWMFSGSLDGTLRCYNVTTGLQIRDTADVGSPIQCMDEAWGTIFIGTKSGHVSRYHVKTGAIKANSIQFSDKSVLALKATNEGPRRVLIVASRSQPITIRDAQSGLFLRTICGQKSHTVYSLMRDHNLIYCGTSSTSILVFDFTNGEQMMQYDAGVGIVCMRLFKKLLFAGCYDGNIYVFNTKDRRLVCSIPGPGNMLLSMEVIDNKIIAGSKDKRLQSWQMSGQVRALL